MKKALLIICLGSCCMIAAAQLPSKCGIIAVRNNGNDHSNNCAGTPGEPVADNFLNTAFANLPSGTKTGEIIFKYSNINSQTLKPYFISKISEAVNGATTDLSIVVGPPAVPTFTGSTEALVKYCTYGINLPTAGTLIFEFTDPETGDIFGSCLYDAGCKTNCLYTNVLSPVQIQQFKLIGSSAGIQMQWQLLEPANTKRFEIEYSSDGLYFSSIYQRRCTSATEYNYTTIPAAKGILYYRVKVIMNNGGAQYSQVMQYKNTNAAIAINKVQLNALLNTLSADVSLEHPGILYMQLTNLNGQVLLNKKINVPNGTSILSLQTPVPFSKGIYMLKIYCQDGVWIQKLVK
jgi:hypothetical protein